MTPPAGLYRDIPRVEPKLLESLRGVRVADLYDALPAAARSAAVLRATLWPIAVSQTTLGPAITAWAPPGDSLMSHCALYVAQHGDVLVISNGGSPEGAVFGGSMAYEARARGIAGAIVDAPIRDIALIRALEFPVWSSAVSLGAGEKRGAGSLNTPISCAGCTVNPGDVITADEDGVLVLSPSLIPALIEAVAETRREDSGLKRQIDTGERIFDLKHFKTLLASRNLTIQPTQWRPSTTRSGD
jgi:4-hydroxy-4-methyl-2-oxoglutarate aldolase